LALNCSNIEVDICSLALRLDLLFQRAYLRFVALSLYLTQKMLNLSSVGFSFKQIADLL